MTPEHDEPGYRLPKILAARRRRELMAMRAELFGKPAGTREDAVLDAVCVRVLDALKALPEPAAVDDRSEAEVGVRPTSPAVLARIGPAR